MLHMQEDTYEKRRETEECQGAELENRKNNLINRYETRLNAISSFPIEVLDCAKRMKEAMKLRKYTRNLEELGEINRIIAICGEEITSKFKAWFGHEMIELPK